MKSSITPADRHALRHDSLVGLLGLRLIHFFVMLVMLCHVPHARKEEPVQEPPLAEPAKEPESLHANIRK